MSVSGVSVDCAKRLNRSRSKRTFSDDRDKAYSMLGMSRPYASPAMPVDCEASVEEVFKPTATHIIQRSKNLDILLYYTCTPSSFHDLSIRCRTGPVTMIPE